MGPLKIGCFAFSRKTDGCFPVGCFYILNYQFPHLSLGQLQRIIAVNHFKTFGRIVCFRLIGTDNRKSAGDYRNIGRDLLNGLKLSLSLEIFALRRVSPAEHAATRHKVPALVVKNKPPINDFIHGFRRRVLIFVISTELYCAVDWRQHHLVDGHHAFRQIHLVACLDDQSSFLQLVFRYRKRKIPVSFHVHDLLHIEIDLQLVGIGRGPIVYMTDTHIGFVVKIFPGTASALRQTAVNP